MAIDINGINDNPIVNVGNPIVILPVVRKNCIPLWVYLIVLLPISWEVDVGGEDIEVTVPWNGTRLVVVDVCIDAALTGVIHTNDITNRSKIRIDFNSRKHFVTILIHPRLDVRIYR